MYNPATVDAEATLLQVMPRAQQLFKLGTMCSTGQCLSLDMVSAHKWLNIADLLGIKDAVRLPNEIAAEMSDREIAAAQRAARHWLTRHQGGNMDELRRSSAGAGFHFSDGTFEARVRPSSPVRFDFGESGDWQSTKS